MPAHATVRASAVTVACAVLIASAPLTSPEGALRSPRESPQRPSFRTTASFVVVDAVVRDKLGQTVSGLVATDFEVREDGRRQVLATFQEVGGVGSPNASSPAASDGSPTSSAERQVSLTSQTALVFEQLGPEARRLARLAALTFLETANAHRQAAVFTLDRGVHQIAPYTADQARLRDAVDRAAGQAGRPMERGGSVPGAEYGSGTAQPSTSTRTDNPYIRAHATLDGLSGVIETLRPHTGRKTIVLFGRARLRCGPDAGQLIVRSPHQDDTWLSDNRREHFTRVIEAANGAGYRSTRSTLPASAYTDHPSGSAKRGVSA